MDEKSLLVSGATWIAEIDISDLEGLDDNVIRMEAATRGVEAWFGKRKDIEIINLPNECLELEKLDDEDRNNMHIALRQLLTDELKKGCGIGRIITVLKDVDPETLTEENWGTHEWYVNSDKVLANAGKHDLVDLFNKVCPELNKSKKKKPSKKKKKN
jgi:hypothetical protein